MMFHSANVAIKTMQDFVKNYQAPFIAKVYRNQQFSF